MKEYEERQQKRAWAVHQWMQRNQGNSWCQQQGQIWLSNLWSTYNENDVNDNRLRFLDWMRAS